MIEPSTLRIMNAEEMRERTMQFAERVLRLVDKLPKSVAGQTVGRQVARSGTSVAANYRAALRCKSRPDFINKITVALEEADKSGFWIELAGRTGLLPKARLSAIHDEALQLTKIFNATRRTAKNHKS